MAFLSDYARGDPVSVLLPNGEVQFVIAMVMNETGISWVDDGYLDPQPGHPPEHHLYGMPDISGPDVLLGGHRFYSSHDNELEAWAKTLHDKDIYAIHAQAEPMLRYQRVMMAGEA